MNDETDVERRAKTLFDDSVAGIDGATLSRLNQSRQQALEQIGNRRRQRFTRFAPAGALAAAAAVAVVMTQSPAPVTMPESADSSDLEILLSGDSIDMLEQLEFYTFMEMVEDGELDEVG